MIQSITFVILFTLIVFPTVVFPIWMVVDCAQRSDKSGKFRAGWIVGMFLIFPLVSYFYALLASQKRLHRIISGIVLTFVAGLIIFLLIFLSVSKTKTLEDIIELRTMVERNTEEQLPQAQKINVIKSLNRIQSEIKSTPRHKLGDKNELKLVSILAYYLEDAQLTSSEARQWLRYVKAPETLTDEEFKRIEEQFQAR